MVAVTKPKRTRKEHFFKEWREYRGLTQDQAISLLGWSQSKISRLESRATPYDQDDLEAASEVYQCSITDLLVINPKKDGEVIDLVRMIDDNNREQAIRILKAIAAP